MQNREENPGTATRYHSHQTPATRTAWEHMKINTNDTMAIQSEAKFAVVEIDNVDWTISCMFAAEAQ